MDHVSEINYYYYYGSMPKREFISCQVEMNALDQKELCTPKLLPFVTPPNKKTFVFLNLELSHEYIPVKIIYQNTQV